MNSIRYELSRIPKIEMETVANRTASENFDEDPSVEKWASHSNRTIGTQALDLILILKKN